MKSLIWFRNDLRITDNPTLIAALESAEFVAGLYCFDTELKPFLGIDRSSSQRQVFLEETLAELKKNLSDLNVPLFIFEGNSSDTITNFVETNGVTKIFLSEELGSEETDSENQIKIRLGTKIEFVVLHSRNMIHPNSLPYTTKSIPDIFTHFRKTAEEYFTSIVPLESPSHKTFLNMESFVPPAELKPYEFGVNRFDSKNFVGGESEALKRLDYYLFTSRAIKNYKETRNGLMGKDDSTKLSPYLSTGALSARVVYKEIRRFEKRFGKNQSTYWVLFELLWRHFFWFVYKKRGVNLFSLNGIGLSSFTYKEQTDENFDKWRNGCTGYPLIDAAMIELKTTGFQSNRMRQNTASFLAKNIGYDWRKGAAWFESQLIDYDIYNNYGNWAYCSGVGNDPKVYRLFNNLLQAEKYDPQGAFIKYWIPNLNGLTPPEIYFPSPETRTKTGYCTPIADLAITPRRGPDNIKGEQLSLFD